MGFCVQRGCHFDPLTRIFMKIRHFLQKSFAFSENVFTFAVPNFKGEFKLRYGVMVALQILALSVRVRVLLSQLRYGEVAQLVRASDS